MDLFNVPHVTGTASESRGQLLHAAHSSAAMCVSDRASYPSSCNDLPTLDFRLNLVSGRVSCETLLRNKGSALLLLLEKISPPMANVCQRSDGQLKNLVSKGKVIIILYWRLYWNTWSERSCFREPSAYSEYRNTFLWCKTTHPVLKTLCESEL